MKGKLFMPMETAILSVGHEVPKTRSSLRSY